MFEFPDRLNDRQIFLEHRTDGDVADVVLVLADEEEQQLQRPLEPLQPHLVALVLLEEDRTFRRLVGHRTRPSKRKAQDGGKHILSQGSEAEVKQRREINSGASLDAVEHR